MTSNRLSDKGLSNEDLAPGKYPYLEDSHYASRTSGRPLSAHVLERSGRKPAEKGEKKPLFKAKKKK